MRIKIWGSRGSIPTPMTNDAYRFKVRRLLELYAKSEDKDIDTFLENVPFHLSNTYGGNTACVQVIDDSSKDIIVLDAGSGLRLLGNDLAGKGGLNIHLFISHFHWDHICGLPFFGPIFNPTNTITFYSTNDEIAENLTRQQHPAHFPISLESTPSEKKFVVINSDHTVKIGGLEIRAVDLIHPGGCSAFVVHSGKKKLSYVTDTEFTEDGIAGKELYYKACFESSDLMLLDCQYSLVEFFSKFNWGHTATNVAVNLALEWRIKQLAMFHFDPMHSDEDLSRMLIEAKSITNPKYNNRNLKVIQAVEGSVIEV